MLRILTGFLFFAMLAGANAADRYPPAPRTVYGVLPECGAADVLARISEKFAYQDQRITMTGLAINRIDRVGQRALRPGGPSRIDRRYCGGRAWLSNGRTSEVVFLIEGPMLGTFSIGWNVESCLPAYDPYRVYDARCRSIRP